MGYLFFITKRKRCVLGLVACWTWAFFLQSKPNRERHIFQGINFNQDCLVGNEGLWWMCWFIVLCVFQRPDKRKWALTTDMEWNTSLVDHRTSIHPGAPELRAQQSQWDGAVSHLYTIWKGAEEGLFFFLTSFFFFWLHWVSITGYGLSQVTVSGGYFVSWCTGFSSSRWLPSLGAQAPGHVGSVAAAPRL